MDGTALAIRAFETVLGSRGAGLVSVSLALFAFSTILGWEFQGEQAFGYLSGRRLLPAYRLAFVLAVLAGAEIRLGAVFLLADICNALMCLPNLLCLLVLSGETARELRAFQGIRRSGRRL